jgi:hypothetical protein
MIADNVINKISKKARSLTLKHLGCPLIKLIDQV